WKPFAKMVLLNCELGPVVRDRGWDHWGKESNKQDTFFAEFKSTGVGAVPKARGLLATLPALAQRQQLTVAADGSGDFRTVQAAFDAVPAGNTTPITILIKKGTYKEKLTLPAGKNEVHLVGTDAAQTVLTFDDYNQRIDPGTGKNIGTSGSGSIHIYGNGFSARNITFENSAGPVGQAVAAW
nr:hypothetical protein [Tanacetum cinerariifolium]